MDSFPRSLYFCVMGQVILPDIRGKLFSARTIAQVIILFIYFVMRLRPYVLSKQLASYPYFSMARFLVLVPALVTDMYLLKCTYLRIR